MQTSEQCTCCSLARLHLMLPSIGRANRKQRIQVSRPTKLGLGYSQRASERETGRKREGASARN